MSKLVPTLLLTAMVYALAAGFSSLPWTTASTPTVGSQTANSAQAEIPVLGTIVVRPDADSEQLATATLLPTVTVYPTTAEIAEAQALEARAVGTGAVIVALHAFGGGLAPSSGLDMPYYSFGKSAYRLRKE
jgi:hypothetical protein